MLLHSVKHQFMYYVFCFLHSTLGCYENININKLKTFVAVLCIALLGSESFLSIRNWETFLQAVLFFSWNKKKEGKRKQSI